MKQHEYQYMMTDFFFFFQLSMYCISLLFFPSFPTFSLPDKSFLLQFSEWCLRGISRVILLNNPLSGALIIAALLLESPWQALLGMLGLLASTLTAIILGQDW